MNTLYTKTIKPILIAKLRLRLLVIKIVAKQINREQIDATHLHQQHLPQSIHVETNSSRINIIWSNLLF